jgi:hypothetical protein
LFPDFLEDSTDEADEAVLSNSTNWLSSSLFWA